MKCCNRKDKGLILICKALYIENKILSNTNPTTNQLFSRLGQTYKKTIMWINCGSGINLIWGRLVCQWIKLENCSFYNLLISDRLLRNVNAFTTVSRCKQWVYSYCLSQSEHNMSYIIVWTSIILMPALY
jgi:hypothetical protein